jgi:hypothetical protein
MDLKACDGGDPPRPAGTLPGPRRIARLRWDESRVVSVEYVMYLNCEQTRFRMAFDLARLSDVELRCTCRRIAPAGLPTRTTHQYAQERSPPPASAIASLHQRLRLLQLGDVWLTEH